jgi:cobalt-zinc-cadmium efflux system outer membrane protein
MAITSRAWLRWSITAYLEVLGTLWTSVVNVADFLQTDDLYQLGQPLELPQLPDFDALHPLPCPHALEACPPTGVMPAPTPALSVGVPTPPAPTMPLMPGQRVTKPPAAWATDLSADATDPGRTTSGPP